MKAEFPVLIIDDDPDIRWALRTILSAAGFVVLEAENGQAGLEIASRTNLGAVLLDMRMPGLSGEEVLARLKSRCRSIAVIMLTGHGSISAAVDAIRAGAFDYLTKPFDNDNVVSVVKLAIAQQSAALPRPNGNLWETVTGLMGHGPAVENLIAEMEMVVDTDYSVLIFGETGTGKEVVAQSLSRHGSRATRPFVVVDCGAIVESLIDSEFFGHERGSYTGATDRRRGRFEMAAEGGTVFLDEIGNLCAIGQRALLRVLEERVIYRVGGTAPINLDIRLIAATNANLAENDDASAFRSDLFYRLSEYTITLPPLRKRPEDIEFLAQRFLGHAERVLERPAADIAPDALNLLRDYSWPGNVRQLRNVIRRASLMTSSRITAAHIKACLPVPSRTVVPMRGHATVAAPLRGQVQDQVRQIERNAILAALTQAGGNKTIAARQLGIDYKTFRVKLKSIEQDTSVSHGLACC
jgi:two-component system nitrogen regulation response regulator GlnG